MPPRLHVAAVLFDMDGTLIDSHDLIARAFREACRTVLGREPSDAEIMGRWGEPLPARLAAVDAGRVPELAAAYTAAYERDHDRLVRPFPGVPEMLAALAARGIRMAVVTSKRRRTTEIGIERLGLAPYIAAAVSAEDVAAPKPAADAVLEAARRLDTDAASACMVGDGVFDIQAARAAGLASVAALWGSREREALLACGPDYVAERPQEVVSLVSG
jgi:pyrophosphatase PpaX